MTEINPKPPSVDFTKWGLSPDLDAALRELGEATFRRDPKAIELARRDCLDMIQRTPVKDQAIARGILQRWGETLLKEVVR